jgi:hypothetical protein
MGKSVIYLGTTRTLVVLKCRTYMFSRMRVYLGGKWEQGKGGGSEKVRSNKSGKTVTANGDLNYVMSVWEEEQKARSQWKSYCLMEQIEGFYARSLDCDK